MKGLLAKDLLTIKNKYGIKRIIMDICIMATLMIFLKGTGAIYISFLLIPIEIMTMIISLTTCDEQWKWNKYVVALPVSKTTIVKSRYIFAFIMSCVGFVVALAINLITYFCFPQFAFGYYLFIAGASFAVTLLFLPASSNLTSFIRKLRKKVEPDPDNPIYIITVWGVGYKFSEEKP